MSSDPNTAPKAPRRGSLMNGVRRLFNRLGFDIVRYRPEDRSTIPADIDKQDVSTIHTVKPYTMTSVERIHAVCSAIRYIESARIPGAVVECGVWRGGSMMAAALTLLETGGGDRELFLFDTFEGMAPPGDKDRSINGEQAADLMASSAKSEDDLFRCYAPLDAVRRAVQSTGYAPDRLHFVPGRVEDTIPDEAPAQIALLRLDTDWYASTKHELEHLFPRLSRGGVLIIDDYGHWQGARAAVDEYLAEKNVALLLNRVDYTGRIAVKAFE